MAKFELFITENEIEYLIKDVINWEELNIETKKVEDQAYYRRNLTGPIRFKKSSDCTLYKIIEGKTNDKTQYCDLFTFRIRKICAAQTFENYIIGDFTVNKININHCRCTVEIELRTIDDLTCLTENWEDEDSFYSAQTFPFLTLLGAIQTQVIDQRHSGFPPPGAFSPAPIGKIPVAVDDGTNIVSPFGGADCNPDNIEWDNGAVAWITARCPSEWWLQTTRGPIIVGPPINVFGVSTTWFREFLVSVSSPGPEWINIVANDWVRMPSTDVQVLQDQGMIFNDSFEVIVNNIGCFTDLVSDFFNINPDGSAPSNVAYTYATTNLHDLLIVSQSDVKRPTASTPAIPEIFIAELKDWLEDLQTIFNIVWFVEGDNLRVEHVSFLTSDPAIDICTDPCLLINNLSVPNREEFSTKEEQSPFFNGSPIIYDTPCGKGTKDRGTKIFNTDPVFIGDNESGFVNEGFVLVSTIIFDSVRYMNNFNRPLAFTELHQVLWIFDRYFFEGEINGVNTVFESTKKIRETVELSCTCQCAQLDGSELINTTFGDGEINTIKENLRSNSLRIQLNLD